ncbi:MAG: DUF533 domain-containing protein [Rhizobiaceae bacterium]
MSLLGTLAKVAIGIAVAKGVGGMMNRGRAGQQQPTGSGGGLGDLLEQLGGGSGGTGGGLGDLIGNSPRGGSDGGGSLGDIFGDFVKDAKPDNEHNGSFGDIFNQSLERQGEPDLQPSRQQEEAAALMLRAMIQAAKSDGKVDRGEREKLMENLGEVSREEKRFVEQEFARPIDIADLARQVPRGLEQQVYLMSVMGIDLDNRKEAQYLHDLATEMSVSRDEVNGIHDHLGVPRIYS